MFALGRMSQVIGAIYDTTFDDDRWCGLSARIAGALGTHSCAIQVRQGDVTTLLGATENVTPALFRNTATITAKRTNG
jgi:hypothetical protein